MKIDTLKKRLRNNETILFNGATGTEILNRGFQTTLPLWSAEILLTHPEVVQKIHEDYIKSGAEIIVTDTFRTTARAFAKKKLSAQKAAEITKLAVQLVKNAIKKVTPDHPVYIAGDVAPLEDCYSPELTPTKKELTKELYTYIKNLKDGGADFILIETQITKEEIEAAFVAAKKLQIPAALTFCINDKLQLLGGDSLEEIVKIAEKYHALFIGANCIHPKLETQAVKKLKQLTKIPISAYAQGDGQPEDNQGWEFTKKEKITSYVKEAKQWIKNGAQIIGGCCGTTPEHIKQLKKIAIDKTINNHYHKFNHE